MKNIKIVKDKELIVEVSNECGIEDLRKYINLHVNLEDEDYYILFNGKKLNNGSVLPDQRIYIVPRLLGGKGGFGSMLRAIGAQIEKTTNREACRDLSGRRLRDINEEKRLKKWISQQADREKEAKERKQKKLEKLCEQPKFDFKDDEYDKERQALPEKVEDAVLKGLEASASCSGTSGKRKIAEKTTAKKKRKLWVDSDLDEDLSSSGEDSDAEQNPKDASISGTTKSTENNGSCKLKSDSKNEDENSKQTDKETEEQNQLRLK